jgi:hypothetical protein
MSALGGGLNRSTQHSISFSLLGFESQGLAHAASDPKVSVFSAVVKPRKYPRCIVIHSIFPPSRIECCVDRLSWQSKADIATGPSNVRFTPKSGHSRLRLECPLCANSGHSAIHSITSSARASSFGTHSGGGWHLCALAVSSHVNIGV